MPTIGSHAQQQQQQENRLIGAAIQKQVPLEVGSIVEVASSSGVTVYGVVRWLGVPTGKTGDWAGLELVGWLSQCTHLSVVPWRQETLPFNLSPCGCSRITK